MPNWTYLCNDCEKESPEDFECCQKDSVVLIGEYPEFGLDMDNMWKLQGYTSIGIDSPEDMAMARRQYKECAEKVREMLDRVCS